MGLNDFERLNLNPPLSAIATEPPLKGGFLVNGQIRDKKGTAFSKMKFKKVEIKRHPNKWFVQYYFKIPVELSKEYDFADWKRFKVYEGINSYKGQEQEEFAHQLLKDVKEQLSSGFDPFKTLIITKAFKDLIIETPINKKTKLTIAMSLFIEQKQSKDRKIQTIQSYLSYIGKIESFLIDTEQADIFVEDLKTDFINDLMQWIESNYEIGATTYNNHIGFLVTLLKWFEMKPRNWIDFKLFDFGTGTNLEKKTAKIMKHKYYAKNVFDLVKKEMAKYPNLLFYSKFIYYSCMRPDEIRNLKLENIDLENRIIRILGKTGFRPVPICNELFEMINILKIESHPLGFYLIGKDGRVNQYQHSENYFTRVFRDDLRTSLKIDSSYTLYGFKHTRVVHLLSAGFKDSEVMQLTGHRDTASYDKYKRELMGNFDSKMTGQTFEF